MADVLYLAFTALNEVDYIVGLTVAGSGDPVGLLGRVVENRFGGEDMWTCGAAWFLALDAN